MRQPAIAYAQLFAVAEAASKSVADNFCCCSWAMASGCTNLLYEPVYFVGCVWKLCLLHVEIRLMLNVVEAFCALSTRYAGGLGHQLRCAHITYKQLDYAQHLPVALSVMQCQQYGTVFVMNLLIVCHHQV